MENYLTPAGCGEAEYTDKKSRFIGQVRPAGDEAAALGMIEEIRKKHPDAAHNVYAYLLREGNISRFSDDGEPGGTSGLPTLGVFRAAGVTDVCCVVTRYFGGVLLGSGGLVRAYSNAARLAMEKAGVARMAWWRGLLITCGYPRFERVKRLLAEFGAVTESEDFGEKVTISALIPEDDAQNFVARLTDLTAGAALCRETAGRFMGVRAD